MLFDFENFRNLKKGEENNLQNTIHILEYDELRSIEIISDIKV